MLMLEDSVRFVSRKWIISMAHLLLVLPLVMPLTGCTGEGGGGPVISSLSAPTDATGKLASEQAPNSTVADTGGEGEEDPMITMTSTPAGVTARLTWDQPSDIKQIAGYYIYYGKRLSEEPGSERSSSEESSLEEPSSCSQGESQAVEAPAATITGLEPNTPYFFAIRAFNDSESICSNEIVVVTPSDQS